MSKQLPKLALVYDAIYPYVKGGGERRFYEMGIRLAKSDFEVHLYGMKFWDGPNVIERDGMYLHGIMKARPLYNKSGKRTISQALLFGLASFKLLGAKFDVIDCSGFPYFSLFPAKLAAVIKSKPLYSTWHEVWGKKYWKEYLGKLGFIGYWVEWMASRLPNTIIANSQHTADLLVTDLGTKRKIAVIPNGINTEIINSVKPSKQTSDIIYAGRLMKFKNLSLLLESISQLKTDGEIYECLIIGDGPDKKRLVNQAKKLKINNQIKWLGFIEDHNEVYALIKSSKVFVQPSKREGFGIVAIEANACGIPVLTTNYPKNATKDLIVDGKNGYIVEPKSTDLADKITNAINKIDKLRLTSTRSTKHLNWKYLSNKQLKVYSI
jgi:glycosyltransferase involved in cell wall biosynthesis